MVACQSGIGLEIVRQLLAAGSDLEARDRSQETALHKAAIHGVVDVLRELILHHKANLFAVDEDGNTPFDVACSRKISEVVNPMLEIYGSKLTKEYGPLASHALLITAKYSFSETRPFHPPLYPLQIRLPLGMPPLEHLRTLMQTLDTESIRNRDDSGKLPIHIACQTNAPVDSGDPCHARGTGPDFASNCRSQWQSAVARMLFRFGGLLQCAVPCGSRRSWYAGRSQSSRSVTASCVVWIDKSVMANRAIFDSVVSRISVDAHPFRDGGCHGFIR
jgi:hypothetical protein